MTSDEHRALAFIAALLLLSAAVRIVALPEPLEPPPAGAGFDLDAHIAATAEAVAAAERRARPLGPGERIDPNTAPVAELDRLPGVGSALAGRIVAARDAGGRFRTTGDLTRVAGIGPRTVERLAPHLELRAGPPTPRPTGPAGSDRAGTGAAGIAEPGGGPRPVPARGGGSRPGASGGGRVDINTADAGALTALPGVGPVIAARIVAHRDSAGPFAAVDSLVAVKGIGPATLERIRARVRVR